MSRTAATPARKMNEQDRKRPTAVYVINSFDGGGAEAGLVTLVEGGIFADFRLFIVGLVRGSGGLDMKLAELGYPPHILVDRVRMHARELPRIMLRLWSFLKDQKPDLIVASLPQANILSRLCMYFRRRPVFVSFEHNTHLAKRAYEMAYRLTSSRVDWAFADAAGTLKIVTRRLYRSPPPMRTVVPLISFPRSELKFPSNKVSGPFRIVNAARFTRIKNQSVLIEAVAILVRERRNVELTLYGDGPERPVCQSLAARLSVGSRIRFPGFVREWSNIPADLFVLTSKHEGLCMVVLEAMHAGIPVMAPIVGGMSDYADSSVLSPLDVVEPGNLAEEIARRMDDVSALATRAKRASEMVSRRFGVACVQDTYREIADALLKESKLRAVRVEPAPIVV